MILQKIRTENQLNKIIKNCRQNNKSAIFLIRSPWDPVSDMIINELESSKDNLKPRVDDLDYFEIDYFELPHAYCIFRARTPSLVSLRGKRTDILDNTMSIRRVLGFDTLASPQGS